MKSILEWLLFRTLDFVWGNGENVWRLFRFVILVLAAMAVYDTAYYGDDPGKFSSYWGSITKSFATFFGTLAPEEYSRLYLATITVVRLYTGWLLPIHYH